MNYNPAGTFSRKQQKGLYRSLVYLHLVRQYYLHAARMMTNMETTATEEVAEAEAQVDVLGAILIA